MRRAIRVVDPQTIDASEAVPGLVERTAFRVGDRRQLLVRVDSESAWHRRDGALYGWVRTGQGTIADGGADNDDERSTELTASDFLQVPAGALHRYVADEPLELLAVVDGGDEPVVCKPSADDESNSDESIEVVGADDLVPTVESPDLVRETPFPDANDVLVMHVRAAGGAAAGWHHHGENTYFGYAVDGPSETQYGPSGERAARIELGECFHVPPILVHRDTNPTDDAHTGIIWLCGGEPWVVNADGPDAAGRPSSEEQ
jgi:mannose-6-phosphate isomerase-like protein (cupin superfamily)